MNAKFSAKAHSLTSGLEYIFQIPQPEKEKYLWLKTYNAVEIHLCAIRSLFVCILSWIIVWNHGHITSRNPAFYSKTPSGG